MIDLKFLEGTPVTRRRASPHSYDKHEALNLKHHLHQVIEITWKCARLTSANVYRVSSDRNGTRIRAGA